MCWFLFSQKVIKIISEQLGRFQFLPIKLSHSLTVWCPFPGIYVHYLTHFELATFIEQLLYVLGIAVGALEFQRG